MSTVLEPWDSWPDPVENSRLVRLHLLGFRGDDLELLTLRRDVDLHEVEDLVGAGCPLRLVLDILL